MEQNMDEGSKYSIQATMGYEPKIKGHMQYLERYVLQMCS